jgi:GTPase
MYDRVELTLKAGNGGNGAITFRREKFVPYGGPFGGDGGDGGDAVVKATGSVSTLRAYKHKKHFVAPNGGNGQTKKKHGADGEDMVLQVPLGTMVIARSDTGEDIVMADLEEEGQFVVVAHGGHGGRGNVHFATSTNQTPRIAEEGKPGQQQNIILELRLIADAGIIGFPNAGKSSLLAAVSSATPKIADYPFTTLEPELGSVTVDGNTFILAEIPGLIEGAHLGKGLGHYFLRHAMRTKVLIHLIDGSSDNPSDNMLKVNAELNQYDPVLAKKPQIVAISKIDLAGPSSRKEEIKVSFETSGITPVFISSVTGEGLKELLDETWRLIQLQNIRIKALLVSSVPVLTPKPLSAPKVHRVGKTFVLVDRHLERAMEDLDLSVPEDRRELDVELDKRGVNKVLDKSGVKSGDTIRCGQKEFKWFKDENRNHGRNV